MTAPIVWHDVRQNIPDRSLRHLAPIWGSTKARARTGDHGCAGRETEHVVVGDLWEREAERDVQAHGEPAPRRGRRAATDDAVTSPIWARNHLRNEIERRRPAMRAARAELESPISETGDDRG